MAINYGIHTSPLEALKHALDEQLSKGKSKLEQDFRQAYPILEQHIAKKMRKKILVDQFNAAYKHELNLIQFRKLLNEERARRHAEGDADALAELRATDRGDRVRVGRDADDQIRACQAVIGVCRSWPARPAHWARAGQC